MHKRSWIFLLLALCPAIWAGGQGADVDLGARVERIFTDLADLNPAVRERADLKLRNLPLEASGLVTQRYARDREELDPETRGRVESVIEMFRALRTIDERLRMHWDWIRENSLRSYDQCSDRSPRWNKPAREAIELTTTWPRTAAQTERMRAAFAQASEAGCEDPLFVYYYALFYGGEPDADDHVTVQMLTEAAASVTRKYPYPAWIRCMVASRARAAIERRPDLKPAGANATVPNAQWIPSFIFEKINPDDKIPEALLFEMADLMTRSSGNSGAEYGYNQLAKNFERNAPRSAYLHVLKGMCWERSALAAPSDVNQGDPPGKAAALREKRLTIAQAELEKAWEMNPLLVNVPTEMLRVLFLQDAERDQIDKWLNRALAVNPDNYQACNMMLSELPMEEKLKFGRECLAGRNWRGRLTFMLVEAHEMMANLAVDKVEYWKQPEVWKDLKAVYDTQFELFPESVWDRSYLALLANRCGQWAEADRQFKVLGDRPALKVFGSRASYEYQRKKAAKNAVAGN